MIICAEAASADYDTIIREDHGVAATHLGGSATTAVAPDPSSRVWRVGLRVSRFP